jgi:hypothetical protein
MNNIININIISQSFMNKNINTQQYAFLLNYCSKVYCVSLHHFIPIQNVIDNDTNQKLNILVNSCWSEILLLNYYNIKNKGIKKLHNAIPKPNTELVLYNNDSKYKFSVISYDFIPFDNLNDEYNIPYITAKPYNNINYVGFSGLPVFIDNKLVGMFSKYIKNSNVVLIIPTYIILKNIEKIDNSHIYKLNYKPTRINNYIIKDNYLYHPSLKCNIPINTYYLLECDLKSKLPNTIIDNNMNNLLFKNVIKKNEKTYLITPRFLSLLKKILNNDTFFNIFKLIRDKLDSLHDNKSDYESDSLHDNKSDYESCSLHDNKSDYESCSLHDNKSDYESCSLHDNKSDYKIFNKNNELWLFFSNNKCLVE